VEHVDGVGSGRSVTLAGDVLRGRFIGHRRGEDGRRVVVGHRYSWARVRKLRSSPVEHGVRAELGA
jgi:hypothetical protein